MIAAIGRLRTTPALAAALIVAGGAALAQMPPLPPPPPPPAAAVLPPVALPPPLAGIVDEFKIGGLAHDVTLGERGKEKGADLNLEVLFVSPEWLRVIGSPRPHLGGDINLSGNTSDAYLGLTWRATLLGNAFRPGDAVFVTGSLGGAVHDGYLLTAPPGRKLLGSRVLFRESVELGYQITPLLSIAAFADHISNADLAPRNAGISNVGARFGFKF